MVAPCILANFFRGNGGKCQVSWKTFSGGGRVFAWGVQGVKKDRRAAWLTVWGVGCLCVWGDGVLF